MSRQEVLYTTCDNCGKVQDGEIIIGWMHLERAGIVRVEQDNPGPWDFCSEGCAIEYLRKLKVGIAQTP